jgi:hypothetical protein
MTVFWKRWTNQGTAILFDPNIHLANNAPSRPVIKINTNSKPIFAQKSQAGGSPSAACQMALGRSETRRTIAQVKRLNVNGLDLNTFLKPFLTG